MITVQMDLNSAITGETKQLAKITIWNTGDGSETFGNYRYLIRGRDGRQIKQGRIIQWPRKARTALALLQRVINDAYPKGSAP